MIESKNGIDVIKLKAVTLIREGSMNYLLTKISSPEDYYDLAKRYIDDMDREIFIALALDTKNRPTAIQTVSIGSLNSSIVHPREVYKMAILSNAASIIVAHNHPSGDPIPSSEDLNISKRLINAGEILGIKMLDHLIIGEDTYYSMKAEMDI